MAPLYDFACTNGHTTERTYTVAELPKLVQCGCGAEARQVILRAPALHLLSTFSRDIDDAEVRATRNPADGSYLDPTLSYDDMGRVVAPITSEKQRRNLMEARGLFEKPPSDKAKDVARLKRTKPVHFVGGNTSVR
jgi:hypothetical protein